MKKIIFLLSASLIICQQVKADIYKYKAPDGRIYYTDKPKHSKYKQVTKSKPLHKVKQQPIAYHHLAKNKKKYRPIIQKFARKYKVDPKLLHAVIQTESAYDTNAISSAGAVGLMQLMPATAKRYGVENRRDPSQNIRGGTHYLRDLLKMFDSNLQLAVAAYNAGENAVKKYNNKIPPYPETRNYVKHVLALYKK